MNREGHKDVSFFIGPEVEHTPAYSKRTLFVVGKQKLDQIERTAREYKTPHIFMGANHSFSSESNDPYWDHVITALLDRGFWVTLDYQAHEHVDVLKMLNRGIWQSRLFVPLLSVRIPNFQTSSPNLTVKIDDIDFKATNEGVWCLNHHEIADSNRFTDWNDYNTDQVVEPLAGPAEILPVKVPVVKTVSIDTLQQVSSPEIVGGELSEVKNDQDAGLDPEPKANPEAETQSEAVATPAEAAEAYAGSTETKKTIKKSKSV